MSKLTPDELSRWFDTIYVNLPEIQLVDAMRAELRRTNISGANFDSILHSNTLPDVLRQVWPDMSPKTAVLIRKLWHADFYRQYPVEFQALDGPRHGKCKQQDILPCSMVDASSSTDHEEAFPNQTFQKTTAVLRKNISSDK